jgi:hypothetical protein
LRSELSAVPPVLMVHTVIWGHGAIGSALALQARG